MHEIVGRQGYARTRIEPAALQAEGLHWINDAIDRYDPSFGAKPNTFVRNTLEGRMLRFVQEHQNVGRLSGARVAHVGRFRKVYEELRERDGLPPGDLELAAAMSQETGRFWNADEVRRMKAELRSDLDATALLSDDGDGGGILSDVAFTQVQQPLYDMRVHEEFDRIVSRMTPEDRRIAEAIRDGGSVDAASRIPGATPVRIRSVVRRLARGLGGIPVGTGV